MLADECSWRKKRKDKSLALITIFKLLIKKKSVWHGNRSLTGIFNITRLYDLSLDMNQVFVSSLIWGVPFQSLQRFSR